MRLEIKTSDNTLEFRTYERCIIVSGKDFLEIGELELVEVGLIKN